MFSTVFSQVLVLFILILLGVIFAKTKLLKDSDVKAITDLVLYTVTPCVIIKSFVREFDKTLLKNLIISFIAVFVAHIIFILVTKLLLHSKTANRQKVLQFGTIFSNCGYMSIPLLQAVLGNDGVFYGSTYIAVFQLFIWSFGIFQMGGKEFITPKKLLINPGLIGFAVALVIFLLQIPVPKVIFEPISYMAGLNTPLPMIIIGYHLANSNLLSGIKDLNLLFATVIKLVILPIIAVFGFYLCGLRGTLPLALTICASAPTAAITTMFSTKFSRDTALSVRMVSLTTVLSIITMPLIVTLAEYLLKG
ncbi:MAG: AEC family transporter [Clostridia bacterium]|nr:AEC family transporter [Clostridia bacterium]